MAKSRVGDIGTLIEITTGADLTAAIATTIKVRIYRLEKPQPFERIMQWTATIKEPATAGILQHTIQAGEFAEAGEYSIAAHIVFEDGSQYTGDTARFTVYDVFK